MKNWYSTRFAPLLAPLLLLFASLVLPLAIFGKIADNVREGHTFTFDDAILNSIHTQSSPARDAFYIQVAKWGGFYGLLPLSVLILAYFAFTRQRSNTLFWGLSIGGTCIINVVAKHIFGRARPALWVSPAPESDFGFPSGHAMLSTAFFMALIVLVWPTKWRIPMLAAGLLSVGLIILSRLYLGVHYPTDVLAGACASLAWVGGLTWLMHSKSRLRSLRDRWRPSHTAIER